MPTNQDDLLQKPLILAKKTAISTLACVLVLTLVGRAVTQRSEVTMKRLVLVLALALVAVLLTPAPTNARGGISVGIGFGAFYSSLGPYGEWITVDAGVYAWRPMRVAAGWRPYWDGRWMWTDDGWYWDSDEPWAWATYHYGRWYYDDYYGWIWTPGYEWAPAWVEWRYGGDYIGWAPLGPYAVFDIHVGIFYRHHWVTPYHYWSFVDCQHMTHHDIHRYVYRTDHNTRFIGRTRTAGSVGYDRGRVVSRGPEAGYVERRGDIRVPRTELVDVESNEQLRSPRTGDRERIGVYRPRVDERHDGGREDRPNNVRERERMPSLDTRQMDVRRRNDARESGREIGRMQPRSLGSEEQRSADRNSRWFEVTPPRVNQDVERPVDPGVRSGRNTERPVDPGVRSGRNTDQQRYERRIEGQPETHVGGNAPRSQDRSSVERSERPSVRPQSEGRSAGRSEGRAAERPSSRGKQR